MPLLRICTWANLRPLLLPTEWERWDLHKTFCFICGFVISFICGYALCSIQGHIFWTLTLILEVGGLTLFVAVSSTSWLILQSFVGGGVCCVQIALNTLSLYRRPKEILQTFFLSCMGTGAVAALKSRAFMKDFGGTVAVQFGQACAQVVAVVVLGMVGLFTTRNLIFLSTYKLVLAIRRSYSTAYVKPMQMTVPDLSKEAAGECSVCLISLADDDGKGVLRLFCAHTFHISCINDWLRVQEACPVCRASVRTFRSCVHIRQEQCVPQVAVTKQAKSLEPLDIKADLADIEANPAIVEAAPATSVVEASTGEFASPRRCISPASVEADSQQLETPCAVADTPRSLASASPASDVMGLPGSETPVPGEIRRKRRSDKPKRKPPKPARARSEDWSAQDSEDIGGLQVRVHSRSSSEGAMSEWSLGSPVLGPSLSRSTVGSIDSIDSMDSVDSVAPHAPPSANAEVRLGREVNLDLDPDVLLQSISSRSPDAEETVINVDHYLLQRAVAQAHAEGAIAMTSSSI